VEIEIAHKKLSKCANDERKLKAQFGNLMAKKIRIRLDDLKAAETLEDTRYLPGNYHELVGNRKGQWACDLHQPNRLVSEPTEDPISEDTNGRYIWKEIKSIRILEIIDYH